MYRAMRADNDTEGVDLIKKFAGALRQTAASFETDAREATSQRRRAQARYLLSWIYSYISSGTAFLAKQGYGVFSQEELAESIRLGELALQYFQEATQELKGDPRDKRSFIARLKEGDRCGRLALLHANLAAAYYQFHEGDLSQNLEIAFNHYESALAILERENLSLLAAYFRTGLGSLLVICPTDHPKAHAELAITHFSKAKEALAPYAPTTRKLKELMDNSQGRSSLRLLPSWIWMLVRPKIWIQVLRGGEKLIFWMIRPEFQAGVDSGLGIAYKQLGELPKAIEHFDLALQALPEDSYDVRARIHLAKGLAYLEAENGDREAHLSAALRSFSEAWEESEEDSILEVLAEVHHVRACLEPEALAVVKPQDREEDLEELRKRLLRAVGTAKKLVMDSDYQEALFLLGRINLLRGDLAHAYGALVNACKTAERVHGHARTPRLKNYLIGMRSRLYELFIRVAREYMDEIAKSPEKPSSECDVVRRSALEFAERARSRFLQEQLATRRLAPRGASPDELEAFYKLRRLWLRTDLKLLELEATADGLLTPEHVPVMRSRRNALESRYEAELRRIREKFGDPAFDPDTPVSSISFTEISSLVNALTGEKETALVEYFITDQTLLAFVVLPAGETSDASLAFLDAGLSRSELNRLAAHWEEGYEKLRSPKDPMHVAQWERKYLLQTLGRLRAAIEAPARVIDAWQRERQKHIERVIVIPHRFLHLVPLHAVSLPDGRLWGESATIQYAPSASVLWRLACESGSSDMRRPESKGIRNGGHVLAVASSAPALSSRLGRDLFFNVYEARTVARATGGQVLEGPAATPRCVVDEMRHASYIHFACHATFDSKSPLEAGLELASEKTACSPETGGSAAPDEKRNGAELPGSGRLTLGEIFERVHLTHAPLVVLSACDTGIPQIEETRDEYVGLPAGFLFAGAKTVVSTLWPVSDVATFILMQDLAREISNGTEPSQALRRAQACLRHLDGERAAAYLDHAAQNEEDPVQRERIAEESKRVRELGRYEACPFASPYWWAGFTVNGLG